MKNRKLVMIVSIIAIILVLFVTLCCCTKENSVLVKNIESTGKYKVITYDTDGSRTYIEMYDIETKVIYGYFSRGYGEGIYPILNSDGTPKLYKES